MGGVICCAEHHGFEYARMTFRDISKLHSYLEMLGNFPSVKNRADCRRRHNTLEDVKLNGRELTAPPAIYVGLGDAFRDSLNRIEPNSILDMDLVSYQFDIHQLFLEKRRNGVTVDSHNQYLDNPSKSGDARCILEAIQLPMVELDRFLMPEKEWDRIYGSHGFSLSKKEVGVRVFNYLTHHYPTMGQL